MAAKIGQTELSTLSFFRVFFRSQVWGLARFWLRWLAWLGTLGKRRAEAFLVVFKISPPGFVFSPSVNPWGLAGCWRWR